MTKESKIENDGAVVFNEEISNIIANVNSISRELSEAKDDNARRQISLRWRKLKLKGNILATFRPSQHLQNNTKDPILGKEAETPAHKGNWNAVAEVTKWAKRKTLLFYMAIRKIEHLRTDLDLRLIVEFMNNSPELARLSNESKREIALFTRYRKFTDGEIVYYQGDVIDNSSAMYFIIDGSLCMYDNPGYSLTARDGESYLSWYGGDINDIRYGNIIKSFSVGNTFGESALVGKNYRSDTIIAQERTVVAEIAKIDFESVIEYEDLNLIASQCLPIFQSQSWTNNNHDMDLLLSFVGRYRLFRCFPRRYLEKMLGAFRIRSFDEGKLIINQGYDNVDYIIVMNGIIDVYAKKEYEELRLNYQSSNDEDESSLYGTYLSTLHENDSFNEIAFLHPSMVQSASLVASTNAICLHLDLDSYKEIFEEYISSQEFSTSFLETSSDERDAIDICYLKNFMKKSPLRLVFNQLSDIAQEQLCRSMKFLHFTTPKVLLQETKPSSLYLVLSGQMDICQPFKTSSDVNLYSLELKNHEYLYSVKAGETYGEYCIHKNKVYEEGKIAENEIVSVIVSPNTQLLCLFQTEAKRILYPVIQNFIFNPQKTISCLQHHDRSMKQIHDLISLLGSTPSLVRYSRCMLEKFFLAMDVLKVPNGQILWTARDEEDGSLYVIIEGIIHLHKGKEEINRSGDNSTPQKHELEIVLKQKLKKEIDRKHVECNTRRKGNRKGNIVENMDEKILRYHKDQDSDKIQQLQIFSESLGKYLPEFGEFISEYLTGDCFGDLSIDGTLKRRKVTAITASSCLLAVVSPSQLQSHSIKANLEYTNDFIKAVQLHPNDRNQEDLEIMSKTLSSIYFFQSYQSKDLLEVCRRAKYRRASRTEIVYKEGELGMACYIIISGHVAVFSRLEDKSSSESLAMDEIKQQDFIKPNSFERKSTVIKPILPTISNHHQLRKILQSKWEKIVSLNPENPSSVANLVDQISMGIDNKHKSNVVYVNHKSRNGKFQYRLNACDVFGEESLLNPYSSRSTTAVMSKDAELLILTFFDIQDICNSEVFPEVDPSVLGIHMRSMMAKERWKQGLAQVLQTNVTPTSWVNVINEAHGTRVQLLIDILKDNSLFKPIHHQSFREICARTIYQTIPPGGTVFDRGAEAERFYVVIKGQINVYFVDGDILLSKYEPNDFFGEYELLIHHPTRFVRACTIKGATIVGIHNSVFFLHWPYKEKMLQIIKLIGNIPIFKNLEVEKLSFLYYSMKSNNFRRNDVLVQQDHCKQRLLLLIEGECHVTKSIEMQRMISPTVPNALMETIPVVSTLTTLLPGSLIMDDNDAVKESVVVSSATAQVLSCQLTLKHNVLGKILGRKITTILAHQNECINLHRTSRLEKSKQIIVLTKPKQVIKEDQEMKNNMNLVCKPPKKNPMHMFEFVRGRQCLTSDKDRQTLSMYKESCDVSFRDVFRSPRTIGSFAQNQNMKLCSPLLDETNLTSSIISSSSSSSSCKNQMEIIKEQAKLQVQLNNSLKKAHPIRPDPERGLLLQGGYPRHRHIYKK